MNRPWKIAAGAAMLVALAACSTVGPGPARKIALTFDDVTLGDGPFFSGSERTGRLIRELRTAGVDEAMFFVTTGNVEREGAAGVARVEAYSEAGHVLANHSHSHDGLSRVPTADYVADVDLAISALDAFDNVEPWYRFPYLDEGGSPNQRDRVRAALADRGLANGYVTINTFDWALVNYSNEAIDAGLEVDLDQLRALYLDVIMKSTEFYDELARDTLGRSPLHVLLLHENDLAALFVGDLVDELRNRGYEIIPATYAFTDPIAAREPDTMWLGQGRIAALAHERGATPERLKPPAEDQDYLRRRFEDEVISTARP